MLTLKSEISEGLISTNPVINGMVKADYAVCAPWEAFECCYGGSKLAKMAIVTEIEYF